MILVILCLFLEKLSSVHLRFGALLTCSVARPATLQSYAENQLLCASHASYSNKPVNLRQLPALSETCFPSAWAIFPYKKDCSKLSHCVLSAFGFCHQSWHHKELVELVKWTEFQYCHEVKHRWKINSVAHRVAGIYGLVIGHIEREPHYSNNGVQDEGKKHVLVEGDSLAAKTPEREKQT